MKGKIILITGGTGSFGNAVLKGLLNSGCNEVRIFSRDEKKQNDMRIEFSNEKIKFYIGDVRDYDSINTAMRDVDYVFHAAALKQVPTCEFFPIEATKTNVLGTHNVIKSANDNNVQKVICLSTDKAAYPINAMGISKALMEKIAIAEARKIKKNGTVICITRYGNVMASRGSVIPLFIKLMNEKKEITVTNPDMTRFMMSLDEAVDLVLYAFKNGQQGDLFVQKSPASTVDDIAKSLKEIFKSNSEIKIIGTRHSEKLYETLLTKEEFAHSEELKNHYRVPLDDRDLNYSKYIDKGDENKLSYKEYHSHNATRLSFKETKDKISGLKYIKTILK